MIFELKCKDLRINNLSFHILINYSKTTFENLEWTVITDCLEIDLGCLPNIIF